MKILLAFLALVSVAGCNISHGAEVKPNLKVLICTGDYGHNAQDRVPMIENAVEKAAPTAKVSWEAHQSYNFTRVLENPGYAAQFDAVVMGDIGIGQLTPTAQKNLVTFVNNGGGLIYVMWAKSNIAFQGSLDAVPMPLAPLLPYAYPQSDQARPESKTIGSDAPFFCGP